LGDLGGFIKTRKINSYFNSATPENLSILAQGKERSKNDLVREAVRQYSQRETTG